MSTCTGAIRCPLPRSGLYTMGGKRKWDWMQREQLDFFANIFLSMGLIVMDVPNQARLLLVALQEARQWLND